MTPIYVPEVSTEGVSLGDIIDAINRRLANYLRRVRQQETGDEETSSWKLRDENIIASTFTVTSDGDLVDSADYTLDSEAGYVTMSVTPALGAVLVFSYQCRYWSEAQAVEAVNAAIDELFAWFWLADTNTVTSDGSQEYLLETSSGVYLSPDDRLTKVEYWNDPHWVRIEGWRVHHDGGHKYVHLSTVLVPYCVVRFSYALRPSHLSDSTDDLETVAGLPARAKEPVVLFACSDLIADRIGPRIREDRAHNTQNENQIKSYELVNDSQFFRARAEAKATRLRRSPLIPRVVT